MCQNWCLHLLCKCVYSVLCSQGPLDCPKGKLFEKPPILWVLWFTRPTRQLCFNFLGLVKLQRNLQARCTPNPQFLKLRILCNSGILARYANKASSSITVRLPATTF